MKTYVGRILFLLYVSALSITNYFSVKSVLALEQSFQNQSAQFAASLTADDLAQNQFKLAEHKLDLLISDGVILGYKTSAISSPLDANISYKTKSFNIAGNPKDSLDIYVVDRIYPPVFWFSLISVLSTIVVIGSMLWLINHLSRSKVTLVKSSLLQLINQSKSLTNGEDVSPNLVVDKIRNFQASEHLANNLVSITERYSLMTQMAHDLRSPLSALDFVNKNIEMPERLRKLSTDSLQRLRLIIESSIASDYAYSPEIQQIDLNFLLENLCQSYKEQFTEIDFIYSSEVQISLKKNQAADICRIISNLFNNSVKARQKDRKLKVDLKCSMASPDTISFSLRDNGRGMTEGKISELLQMSRPISGEIDEISGYGIGLISVRTLLKKYDGILKISSSVGSGTVITFGLAI